MDDSIKIPKKFNRNSDIASSSNSSSNKNYRTDDMSESELEAKNTFDIMSMFSSHHPEDNSAMFRSIKPSKKLSDLIGIIYPEVLDIIEEIQLNLSRKEATKAYKIILHGLPGGGKTALAEAIAGELQWDFYKVSSEELLTQYQGSGNKQISSLFKTIRSSNKKAVLFIDEIDGIANEEHADKNSELSLAVYALHQIDEFKENFICIAATNKFKKVSSSILSRFTIQIQIPLPSKHKTLLILNALLQKDNFIISETGRISSSLDGIDCRHIQSIADSSIRISRLMTGNNDIRTISYDHLLIASYSTQNKPCFAELDIKIILEYWLRRFASKINNNEILELTNNIKLIDKMIGFSSYEIKQCVEYAIESSTERGDNHINRSDLLFGIDGIKKDIFKEDINKNYLDNIQVKSQLRNLLTSADIEISEDSLEAISNDAANTFTIQELQQLVVLTKKIIAYKYLRTNPEYCFYLAIYRLLEVKATPYHVIESLNSTKQYIPWGSINGGIQGPIKAATASFGINANINKYYEYKHFHFTFKKTPLKNITDYMPIKTGGVTNENSRLEYCNINNPSLRFIKIIIKYYLELYELNVDKSINNLFSHVEFIKILILNSLSCFAIRDIIKSVCEITSRNNIGVCTTEELDCALITLNFDIKKYKHADIQDSELPQDYKIHSKLICPNLYDKCIIS